MAERFLHNDSSRRRDKGGRGLCLSIVNHIVEAHQGLGWVESEMGKESCIRFRLPV